MTIKLQKFIAEHSEYSRRKAEELITDNLVQVDGKTATIGQRVDPDTAQVTINGKKLKTDAEAKVYYLLNKPVGYVSTTSDELGRKTVKDLMKGVSQRVYPVGRLDIESEGLLLMTNDGALTQKLTHPSSKVEKEYHVLVAGRPSSKAINHLRRGVKLKDGYTEPATVQKLSTEEESTWLQIVITEGRNRQIRRMMERVGYDVLQLIRVRIGELELDDTPVGKYRKLRLEEIQNFDSEKVV